MRHLSTVSILLLCVAGACAGEDELTCDVLADVNTCWARAAKGLQECMAGASLPGTLDETRTMCAFDNGTLVNFEGQLPTNTESVVDELEDLALEIRSPDGEVCGTFRDTLNNQIAISAGGYNATARLRRGEFSIECGDGQTYTSDFERIFDCAGEGIPAPTDGFELTSDMVRLLVFSAATPEGNLLSCTNTGT